MKKKTPEDLRREGIGWMSILGIMFMFPILFFLCVFLPMWAGWAQVWY